MLHRKTLLFLSVLVSASLLLAACTMDPEKSPAYSKLNTALKKLEDNQTKTQHSVEMLYGTVDVLSDDVKALKAAAQTSSASPEMKKDVASALQRIGQLEQQIKALSDSVGAQKKEAGPSAASPKAATAKSGASAGAASEEPAAAKSTSKAKATTSKAKASASKATSARASKAESKAESKPRGFYYEVQKGDTLESIALKNNLSSADLCRANNLPLSAPLYPGQPIYVPKD